MFIRLKKESTHTCYCSFYLETRASAGGGQLSTSARDCRVWGGARGSPRTVDPYFAPDVDLEAGVVRVIDRSEVSGELALCLHSQLLHGSAKS